MERYFDKAGSEPAGHALPGPILHVHHNLFRRRKRKRPRSTEACRYLWQANSRCELQRHDVLFAEAEPQHRPGADKVTGNLLQRAELDKSAGTRNRNITEPDPDRSHNHFQPPILLVSRRRTVNHRQHMSIVLHCLAHPERISQRNAIIPLGHGH